MISTTIRKVQYTISGTPAASYSIPFAYLDPSYIKAVLSFASGADEVLDYGVDYTVSAAGDSGTLTRVGTWTANATRITIYRESPSTQTTDLRNGQLTDAEQLERMADRASVKTQEGLEAEARTLMVPITDDDVDMTLPKKAARASMNLGFDADGKPVALVDTGCYTPAALWALLLTLDGAGSGFDADMVDGIESARIVFGGDGYASTVITDADAVTKSGFYYINSPFTGAPTTANYHIIHSEAVANYAVQIATLVVSATPLSYIRVRNAGSWSAWSKLWNASNDGAGSGLDADTLDGIPSSRFPFGNSDYATINTTDADAITKSGFYYIGSPFTGTPTGAYCDLIHVATQDNYALQIASLTLSGTTEMYVRTKKPAGWQSWTKLWCGTNDGAGSGLVTDQIPAGTPASSSATGTAGQVCYDSSWMYVCVATNTWKRMALASF